jgi:hypothetical protein
METTHRDDRTDLEKGISKLTDQARTGELLNMRLIGLVVAMLVVVGLWMYLQKSSRSADVDAWRTLDMTMNAESLGKLADSSPNNTIGRVARLQQSRLQFTVEGLPRLTVNDPALRTKGIESIETARDSFRKLAEEFKGDLTMRAQALELAAKAELSLVGIPKSVGGTDYRGTVENAMGYYNELLKTVGEATTAGEATKKKLDELTKKKDDILMLGMTLNNRYKPLAVTPEIKAPDSLKTDTKSSTEPTAPTTITPPPAVTPPAAPPMAPVATPPMTPMAPLGEKK